VQLAAKRRATKIALALAVTLLPGAVARAADEAPGKLTDTWIFWVKAGHQAAFEAGVKAHLAWRKSAGEPFTWNAYQPVVGDDLTHVVYRSGPHHWKDFDANNEWEAKTNSDAKYNEQVAPHLDKVEHYISELDTEHSSWTDNPDYKYFGVTMAELEPGTYGQVNEVLATIHTAVVTQKWPRSYSIAWRIGGRGGMMIVSPFKSFADMADPETPFLKVLGTALGSEDAAKAVFQRFGKSLESERYTVYMARPDLSTPK
jgi:hypothetical protein